MTDHDKHCPASDLSSVNGRCTCPLPEALPGALQSSRTTGQTDPGRSTGGGVGGAAASSSMDASASHRQQAYANAQANRHFELRLATIKPMGEVFSTLIIGVTIIEVAQLASATLIRLLGH
jgi:hypothetical protein